LRAITVGSRLEPEQCEIELIGHRFGGGSWCAKILESRDFALELIYFGVAAVSFAGHLTSRVTGLSSKLLGPNENGMRSRVTEVDLSSKPVGATSVGLGISSVGVGACWQAARFGATKRVWPQNRWRWVPNRWVWVHNQCVWVQNQWRRVPEQCGHYRKLSPKNPNPSSVSENQRPCPVAERAAAPNTPSRQGPRSRGGL